METNESAAPAPAAVDEAQGIAEETAKMILAANGKTWNWQIPAVDQMRTAVELRNPEVRPRSRSKAFLIAFLASIYDEVAEAHYARIKREDRMRARGPLGGRPRDPIPDGAIIIGRNDPATLARQQEERKRIEWRRENPELARARDEEEKERARADAERIAVRDGWRQLDPFQRRCLIAAKRIPAHHELLVELARVGWTPRGNDTFDEPPKDAAELISFLHTGGSK